jgi:hypothetical protein
MGTAGAMTLALTLLFGTRVALAAQEETAPPPSSTPTTSTSPAPAKPVRLDAIRDWNQFLREFNAAIGRRDREALKSCMPKNFLFTLEEYEGNDPRDAAFKEWDRCDIKGWDQIQRVLAKGTRIDPLVPTLTVAPPAWVTDPHYTELRVGFERREGFWRWVWAMRGQ